jgi:hypothetical protein
MKVRLFKMPKFAEKKQSKKEKRESNKKGTSRKHDEDDDDADDDDEDDEPKGKSSGVFTKGDFKTTIKKDTVTIPEIEINLEDEELWQPSSKGNGNFTMALVSKNSHYIISIRGTWVKKGVKI